MKQCPKCNETYSDDSLNFCLNDGSPLNAGWRQDEPTAVFQSGPDVRQTDQINYTPTQAAGGSGYSMTPPSPMPVKKRSKAWVWVLLILGAVVLVCGGGLGALIYIGSQAPKASNIAISVPPTPPPFSKGTPSASPKSGSYDLSLAKYNQIKDGTTRQEAEQILGGPGEEMSSTSAMGTTYSTIKWDGEGFSSVILSFKDDKVFSRVQVGLK